jgi:ATPase subunit of ABC transporter with duplicated ATPase domains
MAGDFSERDRVRLYRMADDLSDVARRRDYLRENASKAYEERQAQMKAEEERMEKTYRERTAQTASKIWSETFSEHPVLSKMDKAILEEVRGAGSEADLLESTPEERAYAVYAGVALPHVVKQFEAATAKVSELEKALSKYKKATPKVSGNTDTTVAVPEDTGFLDAIEKRFSLG